MKRFLQTLTLGCVALALTTTVAMPAAQPPTSTATDYKASTSTAQPSTTAQESVRIPGTQAKLSLVQASAYAIANQLLQAGSNLNTQAFSSPAAFCSRIPNDVKEALITELTRQALISWPRQPIGWGIQTINTHTMLISKVKFSPVGEVRKCSFSPDGNTLASGSSDGSVTIYTRTPNNTWNIVRTFDHTNGGHHISWVTKLSFSPDGNALISESTDSSIKIYTRTNTLEALLQQIQSLQQQQQTH